MINYTERIATLMRDIVERVPTLSFIDLSEVLVFARVGGAHTEGAFATCHCLNLPPSEPGYYFWRDRGTGRLTRRSDWFVTKSPTVHIGLRQIQYLISFSLPRFCEQTLTRSRKTAHYPGAEPWIAKLDTVVHELYHIDPEQPGIRRVERADGTYASHSHGKAFFENVAAIAKTYLATKPHPGTYDFLQYDFADLEARFGGVVGLTFRSFPSYPQRYLEVLEDQPGHDDGRDVRIERLKIPRQQTCYTEDDLHVRQFMLRTSRSMARKSASRAA